MTIQANCLRNPMEIKYTNKVLALLLQPHLMSSSSYIHVAERSRKADKLKICSKSCFDQKSHNTKHVLQEVDSNKVSAKITNTLNLMPHMLTLILGTETILFYKKRKYSPSELVANTTVELFILRYSAVFYCILVGCSYIRL